MAFSSHITQIQAAHNSINSNTGKCDYISLPSYICCEFWSNTATRHSLYMVLYSILGNQPILKIGNISAIINLKKGSPPKRVLCRLYVYRLYQRNTYYMCLTLLLPVPFTRPPIRTLVHTPQPLYYENQRVVFYSL